MATPAAVNCSGAARRILLPGRLATRSFPRFAAVSRSVQLSLGLYTSLLPAKSYDRVPPTIIFLSPQKKLPFHHPPPTARPFTAAETTLLSAALAHHVPAHGFTLEALALAARDLSLLEITPSFLGPAPAARLIGFHLYATRTSLAAQAFQHQDLLQGLSVREKVELLTWLRLRQNEPVIHHWQQALAVMAQPSHVPAAVKELAMLADEVYHLAGDKSVDPSWYTKRGALSGIYAAAELFMTTDTSEGFQETRRFLRRRLQEAEELGGVVKSVGEWVSFTASAGGQCFEEQGLSGYDKILLGVTIWERKDQLSHAK